MFRFKQFLLETPNDGGGGAAPVVPEPPAPQPAPTGGDSPWASDLAAILPDEAVRGSVDTYLRERWQPRMTQFEQQLAEAAPARELYADFQQDPTNTFLGVASEIFEDQPEILERLQGIFTAPETPPTTTPTETPAAGLPPEQAAMLAEWQAERESEQQTKFYNEQVAALQAKHPEDTLIDHARIAPFVIAANGDFDAAYGGYQAWIADFRAATGATAAQAAEAIVAPAAPAVLGTTGADGAGAPPPTAEKFSSLDAALDSAMVDFRASREQPPTSVGSV